MPTSVHIPRHLLEAVDRKARALGVSRNGLIGSAVESEMEHSAGWTPGFFDALSSVSPETASAVEQLRTDVRKARRSKRPVKL